jgi:3-deoxy-D-arabino-heptulosonate 7-phosphate (DAHP) synthase
MSNSRISNTLIGHEALKSRVSLSSEAEETVRVANERTSTIIQFPVNNKKLLIVGPCSADFEDSLLQY